MRRIGKRVASSLIMAALLAALHLRSRWRSAIRFPGGGGLLVPSPRFSHTSDLHFY